MFLKDFMFISVRVFMNFSGWYSAADNDGNAVLCVDRLIDYNPRRTCFMFAEDYDRSQQCNDPVRGWKAMKIRFSKMQGLGNDFMVLDGINQPVPLPAGLIRRLADRHFGVGFDQLLLVGPPAQADNDFSYRIFNNDGGEVEQCGNGARCFVRFVVENGLSDKTVLRVETLRGVIMPCLNDDGSVSVDMGPPRFDPAMVPFIADADTVTHQVGIDDGEYTLSVLSMGNPHAVMLVDDVDHAPVERLGLALQRHERFPQRVNAGFMQVLSRGEVRLRVFERGAGETLACGSGACAAVVAGIRRGLLDAEVLVHARGGDLRIVWQGGDNPVMLTGPAQTVFTGEIEL